MSRKLDELLNKYEWNALQRQQLIIADNKQLDLKYFHPKYDWEQLREIRQALEDGIDPQFLLDKHIDSNSMKRSREAIYEASGMFELNKQTAKKIKQRRVIILFIFILFVFLISVLLVLKKDFIISAFSQLDLTLIDSKYEIGVSKLSDFNYTDLIKSYSKNAVLKLPENEIKGIGEYNLKYGICNESKKKTKSIILIVKDDIKPILEIKNDIVNLPFKSQFNAKDYILKAEDNVDGNLIDKVKISSQVNTSQSQSYMVTYQLEDSSHNCVKKNMKVNVNTQSTGKTKNQNSINTQSQYKPSKKNPVIAQNKVFYFKDYGSSANTEKEALNYAKEMLNKHKANGYRCEPIKSNDLYIGFKVTFN